MPPPKRKPTNSAHTDPCSQPCLHSVPTLTPSPYAVNSGYKPKTNNQLLTALTGKRKHSPTDAWNYTLDVYPEPLVLPGDSIDLDPKYPAQSFQSWVKLGDRNHVTARRNVVYVAAPPEIDESVKLMRGWSRLGGEGASSNSTGREEGYFDIKAVIAYLQAFFYGLEVRLLPMALRYTSWEDSPKPKPRPEARSKATTKHNLDEEIKYIALCTDTEGIRVRVRRAPPVHSASPPSAFPYPYQLNLDDLTDTAMSILPADGYALLLTAIHDMYESDDDDFCCGRAWGASRVAVVSGARYVTALDDLHDVEREHVWPASHCRAFVERVGLSEHTHDDDQETSCGSVNTESDEEVPGAMKHKRRRILDSSAEKFPARPVTSAPPSSSSLPLASAMQAHSHVLPSTSPPPPSALTHLFRVCRTASHELGHTLGLEHCMYRACVMQGTNSVAEDLRQPPYLCSLCEAKVGWAILERERDRERHLNGDDTAHRRKREVADIASLPRTRTPSGTGAGRGRVRREGDQEEQGPVPVMRNWIRQRHTALRDFCRRQGQGSAFAPPAGWHDGMLEVMDQRGL